MCINLQGEETGNHLPGVEEMKTDFRQLRKILEEEYEGLYEYTTKENFDSLFAGQYALINRPVNMNEFFSITAPVTVKTAFGHTSVWMHGGYRREGAGIGLQGDVINKIKDKSLKSKRRPGPNAMSVRDKSLKTKEVSCERGWRGKCLEYLKYLEYLELAIGNGSPLEGGQGDVIKKIKVKR